MSKTTNKFSPEVRSRAVWMVLDNESHHGSLWQTVMSIAAKIGCAPQTLNDWVKKAEVDSGKPSVSSAGPEHVVVKRFRLCRDLEGLCLRMYSDGREWAEGEARPMASHHAAVAALAN